MEKLKKPVQVTIVILLSLIQSSLIVCDAKFKDDKFSEVSPNQWKKHFNSSNECLMTGLFGSDVQNDGCKIQWFKISDLKNCFASKPLILFEGTSKLLNCIRIENASIIIDNKWIKENYECHMLCPFRLYTNHHHHNHQKKQLKPTEESQQTNDKKRPGNSQESSEVKKTEVFKNMQIGEVNIPDQNEMDHPGPVTDRASQIFLKAYEKLDEYSFMTWFVVPSAYSVKNFSNTGTQSQIQKKEFFNSTLSLKIFEFMLTFQQDEELKKIEFHPGNGKVSTIEINRMTELNKGCFSKNSYTEMLSLDAKPEFISKIYTVCLNGTVLETEVSVNERSNCTDLFLNKKYVKCDHTPTDCDINKISQISDDLFQIELSLEHPGTIQLSTEFGIQKITCHKICNKEITVLENLKVTCPDQSVKTYHRIKDYSKDCPLISYWATSKIAASFCRSTFSPKTAILLIFWLCLGKLVLKLLCSLMQVGFQFLISIIGRLKDPSLSNINYNFCSDCGTRIEFDSLTSEHKSCKKGVCPYCRKSVKNVTKFHKHCVDCDMRQEILEKARERYVKAIKPKKTLTSISRTVGNRAINTTGYILITIVLVLQMISPTTARANDINDDWEEFVTELRECGPNCWRTSEACECPEKNYRGSRVLLSAMSPNSITSGYMNINSTFEITENQKVVDMTFSTSVKSKDNILVSGNSIITMPLDPETGITWKLTSSDSKEVKKLSIGIYDSAQVYSSVFRYYTSDRVLSTHQKFSCEESCKEDCECPHSTCKFRKYENDRAWNCNPTWCWSWGTGCTCCNVYADLTQSKYIFSMWDLKYERTELILCMNYDHPKYSCFPIKEGGNFNIDNFHIKVTNIFGIDRKLPKSVIAVHKKNGKSFDASNPDTILLDPEIRSPNSINHGEVGDISYFSLHDYFSHPQENINMKWNGVNIERTCTTAQYPTCTYQNMIENNTDAFDNLIETSEQISNDYHIHTLKHDLNTNNLIVKTRPYKGAGQVQIALTVKNLELKRSEIEVKVNQFKITECGGCRGCHTGFWCMVKISLISPEKYSLHLYSRSKNVVIETNSIIAKNTVSSYNISAYTPVLIDLLEICIEEVNMCASSSIIELEEPPKLLIQKGKLLISTSEKLGPQDGDLIHNYVYGLKKTFFGMISFLGDVFLDLKTASTLIGMVIIVYLVFFTRFGRMALCFIPNLIYSRKNKQPKDRNPIMETDTPALTPRAPIGGKPNDSFDEVFLVGDESTMSNSEEEESKMEEQNVSKTESDLETSPIPKVPSQISLFRQSWRGRSDSN